MLSLVAAARVPNLHPLLSRIESLHLERTFDCVIASSHLINTIEDEQRQTFVRCIRDHLKPDGIALFEVVRPDWFVNGAALEGEGVRLECDWVDESRNLWRGRVLYHFDDVEFEERLVNRLLDLAAIDRLLAQHQLVREGPAINVSPVDMLVVAHGRDLSATTLRG